MSGRIPQHFIDELVARADLVELISSRVPLRKAGKEYKACCPFHDEKSPSFTVVPDKQFYHCFGCGAHGTALGFLMEYDHLGFVEAVEELAARLGLEVPREHDPSQKPQPADDLYRILQQVGEFFASELGRNERAGDYVASRGLGPETVATFGIGYAPAAWDAVLSRFGRDEHARRQLHAVGLIVERERAERSGPGPQRGYYDRFRDRIMFPIRDSRGRTIGFGGRVLDRGEPKYLNSPESELFHKGRELYGLYEARKATRSLSRLLVVEGYMDVVRLHQAGLTYAVATLGTATTPDHLTRLFRATNEVVFCFDGDRAGRAAAWRALTNALGLIREGRQVRFLFLPEGQDPDSLVGAEGAEAFEARLATAVPLSEVLIRDLKMRFDTASVDGRAQLAEAARPLLQKLPAGVYRELLTAEIARTVGMPEQRFEALLDAAAGPAPSPAIQGERGRPRPVSSGPGSTGRRNLVRQAIHLLVHHPGAALAIADHESLGIVDRPGVPLLVQLLTELRDDPAGSTGQLLERWRGRPDYESLAKLAARECLVPDLTGARLELQEAVARLIREEAPGRRLDVLLEKSRAAPLSEEEKHELQGLLQATATARTHRES